MASALQQAKPYAVPQVLGFVQPKLARLGVGGEPGLPELFQHPLQVVQVVLPGGRVYHHVIEVGQVGPKCDVSQLLEGCRCSVQYKEEDPVLPGPRHRTEGGLGTG